MPSGTIPPPPRLLLAGLAMMTLLCFMGGFLVSRAAGSPSPLSWGTKGVSSVSSVALFFPTEEGASPWLQEYQGQGYHVSLNPIESTIPVQLGFVVTDQLAPEAANSAAEALSKAYHFPVALKTESSERVSVQVGPVFEDEEEAKSLVNRLKQLGYQWSVKPNYVEKYGTHYKLLIENVPTDTATMIKEKFEEQGIKADVTQTP